MKGNCESKTLHMDGARKINGNSAHKVRKVKRLNIASLNSHLICVLCSGYYVEATAIVECLHTFCRSCIVKYMQSNSFCPICDVQIHQAKPWSSLRPDKTLQDLVYKLVPGLYQNEMRRRRQFYSHLRGASNVEEGEGVGFLPHGARFFSQDDSISLSLEYYNGFDVGVDEGLEFSKQLIPKRYLQCPAAVTVRHLKKFLRMKYGIGLDCWVDIIYDDECLPDDFSLIDVAYTFTWKRTSPMRFSYRIYSKVSLKTVKSQKNFQTPRVDEEDNKKSKRQSSLEQQMQNEYLGNFNLNPTNSNLCKNQSYSKTKNHANNNNSSSVRNNNTINEKKQKKDYVFRDSNEFLDGIGEKLFQSSEESSASGLQIISEKEESLKGNSEDSRESVIIEEKSKKKFSTPVTNFEEEAVDGFIVKKLLRSKHKSEGKRERKQLEETLGEKRRRSAGHAEEHDETRKKYSQAKRRKSMADEFSLKREVEENILGAFSVQTEDEDLDSMGKLKNEALRKVFVSKEKPEINSSNGSGKRKDGEFRRKKRKKSKHHEGETKKRKSEIVVSSPSIMSFAKDPLKLKVKLTPGKPVIKAVTEEVKKVDEIDLGGESDREVKKLDEKDGKKSTTDKERLLHLRAVRHKSIVKGISNDYINAPPSLTISKVDSSEQQPVKSTLVESRPSLEIMLVNPVDNSKGKKIELNPEPRKEMDLHKVESTAKESRNHSEVMDNFGVLDLSEKSTRTKEISSNSSSPKDVSETVERCRKSTHQSILHIAQTLVNRKLSPILPDNPLIREGFDGATESCVTAAAMRNLKTLSDTAVNILMAAQSKTFSSCGSEVQKRTFATFSAPVHKSLNPLNSTKLIKDCENGSGLKIPTYPISRDRPGAIPPVPNLHEIYPRSRGRPLALSRPPTPTIKPGQNQTVRQIPNPFVVLNRQTNQIRSLSPRPKSPLHADGTSEDASPARPKPNAVPPLQSIKTKFPPPKSEDPNDANGDKNVSIDFKGLVPKVTNNNTKTIQNGSDTNFFGLKNGEDKKGGAKLNHGVNSIRKIENMAKNIESVAAGLTARAVSNAMIDAK